jgi:hypothetical protein
MSADTRTSLLPSSACFSCYGTASSLVTRWSEFMNITLFAELCVALPINPVYWQLRSEHNHSEILCKKKKSKKVKRFWEMFCRPPKHQTM